jgi:quercetin dioxygenase-like cupin family protein
MSDAKGTGIQVRRIVTTHNEAGQSAIWCDGIMANVHHPHDKQSLCQLWATEGSPAEYNVKEDKCDHTIGDIAPPANGTRLFAMEILPGNTLHGLHRTDTVDYIICVAGEFDLILDSCTTTIKQGDVLVELGTNHAFANRGNEPARIISVLIDGGPKRGGGPARFRTVVKNPAPPVGA